MNISWSHDIEAFRREVRGFIRTHLPDEIRCQVAEEQMDLSREDLIRWHKILNEQGGWGCPNWPVEHGGPGWNFEQQYVFERELALNDAPRLMIYGVGMLGPTLMEFGSDEQKRLFLPPILRGDVYWCQGFSEPNAGSDLAALKCRADRDGDDYVVNGSKIWTSDAHHADWIFGLYRTASDGKKQHGITFLLIDLDSPGITLRPLLTFEGTHEVNQVFFDDVRVPARQRLGEEHRGWTYAKYLLGLERFGTAEISRSMASLGRLKSLVADIAADEGGTYYRDAADNVEIELRALELTEQRLLFGPGGPDAMGPEASMLKVRGTELQQRILELSMEALGPVGQIDRPRDAQLGSNRASFEQAGRNYFNYRKTSIYAGSNEIQKNIIAKAVLGL